MCSWRTATLQLSICIKQAMSTEPSGVTVEKPSPSATNVNQYTRLKLLAGRLIKESTAMGPVRGHHQYQSKALPRQACWEQQGGRE